jgi:adenylate kinase
MKKINKKKKPALNLILLGDPGAGKATQAAMLAKKYSFFDFDMGRELTLQRQTDSKIDAIHKKTTDQGNLTPTKIVRELFRNKLSQLSSDEGIVFDGTPKMLGEAKLIYGLLKKSKRPNPLVIYLKIPQNEVVSRVTNRKGYFNTKFSQRSDDSIQALKNRAKYYRTNIKQVTDFFKQNYSFVLIDGIGSRTEVQKRILDAISKYEKVH